MRRYPIRISPASTEASIGKAMHSGQVKLVANINHCRDCERAYEMGQQPPKGHPLCLEELGTP